MRSRRQWTARPPPPARSPRRRRPQDPAAAAAKKADRDAKKAAKAAEKAAKEAAKAAAKAAEDARRLAALTEADPDDPLRAQYGDAAMVQSVAVSGRAWTDVAALAPALAGQTVLVRARVAAVRGKGKSAFLVLRQGGATAQAVLFVDDATVSKGMVRYASNLSKESVVDLEGVVALPAEPVGACSQADVELKVTAVRCVSRAASPLPFEVSDAARSARAIAEGAARGEQWNTVGQDTRLDARVVDLRTPANRAIFRLQSAVCALFREALAADGFVEIHTPKLLGGASEGGAAVFRVDYMGRPACLAQSPQFYKQMAVCADLGRVFEIGPVFRAEDSNTHRHLTEFVGLDFEMPIAEHYSEVMDVLDRLFVSMFTGLNARCAAELAAVNEQYEFAPLRFAPVTPRLTFEEGVAMLAAAGVEVDPLGDLSTEAERALGKLVAEKLGVDFYILHRYPAAARPFYTMPCADDARYSCSFDVFIRGEEIISGAQRVHDAALLEARAVACGVVPETIRGYLDAFKFGATPHGGLGVGLERVVMLFAGLDNIRKTSMFPRDPKRLAP